VQLSELCLGESGAGRPGSAPSSPLGGLEVGAVCELRCRACLRAGLLEEQLEGKVDERSIPASPASFSSDKFIYWGKKKGHETCAKAV